MHVEIDARHGHHVAVTHDELARLQRHLRLIRPRGGPYRVTGQTRSKVVAAPARIAHRHWEWVPADGLTEPHDRWSHIADAHHLSRASRAHVSEGIEDHDHVGVFDDAFEPMFGEHHGDPEVVHQPGQRGEHIFGRGRVERRRRLVEHEDLRMCRQN